MTDNRVVWLNDTVVGHLRRDDGGFTFASLPGARNLTAAAEGAQSPWSRTFAKNWFDGLLPDDRQRTGAEDARGIERGDTFALLEAIGWECAGAVSVLPEGRRPASGSYRRIDTSAVWDRLEALPMFIDDDEEHVRMSLGGAQQKLLLRRDAAGWLLPMDGAISSHIIKPEPQIFPGLAIAEAFSLLAASAATPAAEAEVITATGSRPALVVTRFDREVVNGEIRRIHQEDACQVLGLPPNMKFARQPKPSPAWASYGALAKVIFRRGEDPTVELGRLLEQMTVNVALGNLDAHGKNYSVQHVGAAIRMSPMYDVAPNRFLLKEATNREARYSAMLIGGKRLFDEITKGVILQEAVAWRIPEQAARSIITATLDRLAEGIAKAKQTYPGLRAEVRDEVDGHFRRLNESDW